VKLKPEALNFNQAGGHDRRRQVAVQARGGRSVEPVGRVGEPGINVLTAGGQDQPEEPVVATGGLGLKQVKVVLLAFDRAFGTGAGIAMSLPAGGVSRDKRMEAVVLFGIGVDDPAIG